MPIALRSNDIYESEDHPLDSIEDVLNAHNWVFERINDDELMVEVAGKSCHYRVFFIWQPDMSALQFCCQYDLVVNEENVDTAQKAIMRLNEELWMGHYDLPESTLTPTFRHTCLMRGIHTFAGSEHLEDLIEVSLLQCERHFPVFYLLSGEERVDEYGLSLALMPTPGEA